MSGDDDSDLEGCDILLPKKKKSGSKSSWMPEDIDDLVDIVINNAYYQRKLVFANICQRNSEIYEDISKELKLRVLNRGNELKFTAKHLRKCVSALLQLLKSRDSCQPDQAVEPGSTKQRFVTESEELINSEAPCDEEKFKDSKRKVEKKFSFQ